MKRMNELKNGKSGEGKHSPSPYYVLGTSQACAFNLVQFNPYNKIYKSNNTIIRCFYL